MDFCTGMNSVVVVIGLKIKVVRCGPYPVAYTRLSFMPSFVSVSLRFALRLRRSHQYRRGRWRISSHRVFLHHLIPAATVKARGMIHNHDGIGNSIKEQYANSPRHANL